MRSDRNLDLYRDSPAFLARVWRDAADASLRDFPADLKRWAHYDAQANVYERSICETVNPSSGVVVAR